MLLAGFWTPYIDNPDLTSILTASDLARSCSGWLEFKLINFPTRFTKNLFIRVVSVSPHWATYGLVAYQHNLGGGGSIQLLKYRFTLRNHWSWNKAHRHSETTGHRTKHTSTIYGDVPSAFAFRQCLFNHLESQPNSIYLLVLLLQQYWKLANTRHTRPALFRVFSFKLKSMWILPYLLIVS